METHQGRCLQLRQAELSGTVILLGTLPGTPFLCLSAVSSPFWSLFLSSALICRTIAIGSIPRLRRVFSISMALSSEVIFARFFWDFRTPCIISGVKNGEGFLFAAVNVAGSFNTVPSVSPGASVGDATWDALSSSVSCFEPFLVTLFVACDRAMVSVFVLLSGLSSLWNVL